MLYYLLAPLGKKYLLFNLINYLSFRAAAAMVTALLIAFVIGPSMIEWLRLKQGKGQSIRTDGLQWLVPEK